MNNDLLTIKEVAEITGFSKQNIYQQLSTNLKDYLIQVDNKKMLKRIVITEYFKIDLNKNSQVESIKNSQVESSRSSKNNYIIDFFKEEIKLKNEQLQEKDKIIYELTERITDLTERLAVLFENSQQIQKNQQLLEVKNIIHDDMESEEIKEKKKGFFKKIFNKNK